MIPGCESVSGQVKGFKNMLLEEVTCIRHTSALERTWTDADGQIEFFRLYLNFHRLAVNWHNKLNEGHYYFSPYGKGIISKQNETQNETIKISSVEFYMTPKRL